MEGMQIIQEFDNQTPQSPNNTQSTISSSAQQQKEFSSAATTNYNSYNNWDSQDISPAHKNIIADIIWLDKSNLLVSSSSDGTIKLWN